MLRAAAEHLLGRDEGGPAGHHQVRAVRRVPRPDDHQAPLPRAPLQQSDEEACRRVLLLALLLRIRAQSWRQTHQVPNRHGNTSAPPAKDLGGHRLQKRLGLPLQSADSRGLRTPHRLLRPQLQDARLPISLLRGPDFYRGERTCRSSSRLLHGELSPEDQRGPNKKFIKVIRVGGRSWGWYRKRRGEKNEPNEPSQQPQPWNSRHREREYRLRTRGPNPFLQPIKWKQLFFQ